MKYKALEMSRSANGGGFGEFGGGEKRALCFPVYGILYFIFYILYLTPTVVSAQPVLMRDIFAAMPDSILPLVTKNNRLDCIDFIENNMEAKVRNRMDAYVTLEALTPNYLRFRTSASAFIEMRSLTWHPNDTTSTQIVALVRTAEGGIGDMAVRHSNLTFITPDWKPLPLSFEAPALNAFFTSTLSDSTLVEPARLAQRSLQYFQSVQLRLSADEETLTCMLQTGDLSRDERRAALQLVQPVVLHWDGTKFVRR